MKRTYLMLIIAMLVIGFAAVTTNLVINGTINFGFNNDDFNDGIVFSYTNTMHGEATILDKGKSITFETTKLETVGDQAIMDFDIANKSSQYDAIVTITCGLEKSFEIYDEYIDINLSLNSPFEIESGATESGRLTITLKKAYNESLTKDIDMLCTIEATAKERDTEGKYIPKEHEYKEILLQGADPVLDIPTEAMSIDTTTNKKLIPVMIDEKGKVTRADTTEEWYDYETKNWANAVILNDGVAEPDVGSEIKETDIESYFVWIPKFQYQIFNLNLYNNVQASVEDKGSTQPIQIKFGLNNSIDDTSTKQCAAPMNSDNTYALSGSNGNCHVGDWMTHPAFLAFNTTGFWVGKFETGYKDATDQTMKTENSAITNVVNTDKIIIKPNSYSWQWITAANAFKNSLQYKSDLTSHMMKNTEWGAVAYLTQSIYGRCTSDSCEEVRLNNSKNFVTGVAAKEIPSYTLENYSDIGYGTVTPYVDNTKSYVYPNSQEASTTGNLSGIFDMSGGSWEYVMAVMTSATTVNDLSKDKIHVGKSTLDLESDIPDERYVDLYLQTTMNYNYSYRILGDATGEIGPFGTRKDHYYSTMFEDFGRSISISWPWFERGCNYYSGKTTGLFAFNDNAGQVTIDTYRIILSPKN